MLNVHILTPGFASPNGRAFLFPLHVHRRRLVDLGVQFRCFMQPAPHVADCDVLIIDSRFYSKRWANDEQAALDELAAFSQRIKSVLYFDISDSTGWLQAQVLPFVTRYYKAQLLKDREAYRTPHYGNRIYADYYHRKFGVTDDEPVTSRLAGSAGDLDKLRVSWNSGLANYSLWGPAFMALRQRIPWDRLLQFPRDFTPAQRDRTIAFTSRFGINYQRETVSYQRRKIRKLLGERVPAGKLSRRAYLEEMRNARVVLSPFGFGEITLKDFEAFLCGALLFKPDMSHMETWPDLFRDGETMVSHHWDLSDFEEILDTALEDASRSIDLAERGQQAYRHYLASESGYQEFCLRFSRIVKDTHIQ